MLAEADSFAQSSTIADLQAERERIKAAQAKSDYELALADTCSAADLAAATEAVREAVLAGLDGLLRLLAEAAENESDETRVHYLLSDAAHGWATRLGEQAAAVSGALPDVGAAFRRGIKPRDLISVAEWADRHRELKSGTNAPGPWRTELTPYLREIMDALSEHSSVRQVTFVKSSGVGGTEALFNWIGYIMHHLGNKDLLVVQPTLELRDRSFNPRLTKMLEESRALAGLASHASRNKANRGDLLEYGARSRIIKAGANSPDSLRSDHLPYVICDEVDAFPWDVGGEGDPMTLIENRQRTFTRAKTYLVSTPTEKSGESRIVKEYKRSDMRRFFVPCPHCGEYQRLEFGGKDVPYGLKFSRRLRREGEEGPEQVDRAWYVCRANACIIEETDKTAMLAKARWIAERPHIKHHRGYHINALYAPVGIGLPWRKVAQKWLDVQGDSSELKAFFNTYLGEVFVEENENIDDVPLITRLEAFPARLAVAVRTAGVDVQKDRLEVTIIDWGAGRECWVQEHIIIPGDTLQRAAWDELHEILTTLRVQIAVVDAGFNTTAVEEFCRPRKWAIPGKGVTGMHRPVVEDEKKRRQRLRTRRKKGMPQEPIGVDDAKKIVYGLLKNQQPGRGYVHFRDDACFDEEYFAQLSAEKLVKKRKGYRQWDEWEKTRPRNEALDCFVYAMAAMLLSGVNLESVVLPPPAADEQPQKEKQQPKPRRQTSGITNPEWSKRL